MQLTTNKDFSVLRLLPGETLQVVFDPNGVNGIIDSVQVTGLTIGTRVLDSGRMVLTFYSHHDNFYVDNGKQLVLIDDTNKPTTLSLPWRFGTMELKKFGGGGWD